MNESERQVRAAVHACGEDYDTVGTLHCPDATCETIYAVARDIDRQRKEARKRIDPAFTITVQPYTANPNARLYTGNTHADDAALDAILGVHTFPMAEFDTILARVQDAGYRLETT